MCPTRKWPAGFARRYSSGRELAAAGLAELADLKILKLFKRNGTSKVRKRPKAVR